MKPITILASLVLPTLLVAAACGSNSGTSFVNGGGSGGTGNGNGGSSNAGGSSNGSGAGSGGLVINAPSDGGAAGATDTCGGTKLAAAPIAANVLLVVDKSSSMTHTPDGFGSAKWPAMQTALAAAVDATKGSVAFGLDFFPNSDDPTMALPNGCSLPTKDDPVVGVSASAANTAAIKQALTDNAPAGSTPTAGALARALDYFTTGAGAKLTGTNYVLLATDGGPNCNPALTCPLATCTTNMDGNGCPAKTDNCCDAQLDPNGPLSCLDEDATVAAVQALAKAKIKTFVVGIPGTEAYQTTLNALGTAGGIINPNAPPSYFAVSATGGAQALSDVLTSITTALITTCTLKLTDNPPDYDQINVVLDGTTIAEGSADGWALDTSTVPPSVILKGATCQRVETTGVQQVDITFGCPTVHIR